MLCVNFAFSQSGGKHAYEFLNLTNSSRLVALGGNFSSAFDDDISLALSNPSIISESINNQLLLNYVDYFSDINFGYISYSKTFEKYGSFAASMQYVNYGTFTEADETGEILGDFSAGDMALTLGWGRALHPNFSVGANLKSIYSSYYLYNSFGLAVDVAGTYHNPEHLFSTSLLVKNIGSQIKPYNIGYTEPLPFEVQLAMSKKLEHVPLRFYLLLHNLQKYDITYNDASAGKKYDPFTGLEIAPSKVEDAANKLMHHVVLGVELSPTKSFALRLGYNYHRRKEMIVDSRLSTVGISWGFGFKVYKFAFSYARSAYHLAGSPNVITITTNISDFYKKDKE